MNQYQPQSTQAQSQAYARDEGLRSWMMKVYNYMASGLLLTAIVAYVAGTSPAFLQMMMTQGANGAVQLTPLAWILMFAPLGMALFLGFRLMSMSYSTGRTLFFVYSALMGLSLYYVLVMFTGESVVRTFLICSAMFGGMSMYGYTTKKDLTSMGSFLMMGVLGLVIASVVNIFMQSSTMAWIISGVGVICFTGLIAYDTQKLKAIYYQVAGDAEQAGKSAVMGAFSLYLDFINLFLSLLRFFGERR